MLRSVIMSFLIQTVPVAVLAQTAPPPAAPVTDQVSVPAILVADEVRVDQNRILRAQGNVEAFQNGVRLKASAIAYDQSTGALSISGPITIVEGDDIVILADQAELSRDMRNGLLMGARMVLSRQLQLAAVEMNRVNGRYTQLYKTAITSCQVCENGKPPLWQIRAKRIIHDQEEQQLYFDQAQFLIGTVPVFYLPRLRLPDPTLERASGFLLPSLRTTSRLGTGVKIPYFFKIGDHRDLTLTPYLSSRTKTLEFRYRQAFRNGRIGFTGALSNDELLPDTNRGYVFGEGRFELARDYVLAFDIETTSDDAYLTEYGYASKDRLDSGISVSRARRDKYVYAGFVNFKTLRDGEENSTLPTNVIDVTYAQRFFPKALGGELAFSANAHGHARQSGLDTDSADADTIVDGRDMLRVNVNLEWSRLWTSRSGFQTRAQLGLAGGVYHVNQDARYTETETALNPYGALTLRYPAIKRGVKGTHLLEPVLQIGWLGGTHLDLPVDESSRPEFDEGNLLSLSRFPRPDQRETGITLATGVNWRYHARAGWSTNLTFGNVLRSESHSSFTKSSGLDGRVSDFLIAGQFKTMNGLEITGRGLFDRDLDFTKAEVRGTWVNQRVQIGGNYLWLTEDADEGRTLAVSEFTFDGAYKINRHWTAKAQWRYDLVDDRASGVGVGFSYENECVLMNLFVNRRNTASTTLEPSTDLGFTVSLRGFSASNGSQQMSRSCGKQAK